MLETLVLLVAFQAGQPAPGPQRRAIANANGQFALQDQDIRAGG